MHEDDGVMSKELNKAINNATESASEDITEEIEDEYGAIAKQMDYRGRLESLEIIWNNKPTTKPSNNLNTKLLSELRWIKQLKTTRDSVRHRNKPHGTLDRHSLYKGAYSPNVYKVDKTIDRQKLDLVLLLDASSSMYKNMLSILLQKHFML